MCQVFIEVLIDFEGVLVVVLYDCYLICFIIDDFYLVYDKKVELFDGDLEDY